MNALGSLQPLTAEQGMQMGRMFINAFPDGRSTIEEQIVQGDRVATRGTYRGTHQGDFMGMPATGKRIEVPWLSMDKIAGGKLVEHRFLMDTQVMMQQLGVASPPR
jgi:predicted ester cyclase